MTASRPRARFTLVGGVLLIAALATRAQAAPERAHSGALAIALAVGDAGPDADMDADFDATLPTVDAEINDPARDNSDCRIAPGGQSGAPLSPVIALAGVLLIARRRRE